MVKNVFGILPKWLIRHGAVGWQLSLQALVVVHWLERQGFAVGGRWIWAARFGALKVVWQMRTCQLESLGANLGEDLVLGQWPKQGMATY